MYNLISDSKVVYNNNIDYIITPLLMTCVIAVGSIYMGFQELAPISNTYINMLLKSLVQCTLFIK